MEAANLQTERSRSSSDALRSFTSTKASIDRTLRGKEPSRGIVTVIMLAKK
jgi:hypothetical protein